MGARGPRAGPVLRKPALSGTRDGLTDVAAAVPHPNA